MADVPFATNLLPQYQSPQQMQIQGAQAQNLTADAALTNTQNQGAQIANQRSALQLGLLQNYLGDTQSGASAPSVPTPPAGGSAPAAIGATGVNPDDVTGYAFSKYAPLPTARPASVIAQMTRANLAGLPEVAANIGAQYDAQVAGANQQRQLGANAAYQTAEQVAGAPDGAAFETLNRYNPDAAAAIKAKYPTDTPDQLDADVRAYAQHIGIATHQYTGRDADFQNGVLVDKKDGKPVLGSGQVLTGLDAAGKQKAFDDANTMVTVGDSLPMPKYQAAGFHSAEAYAIAADRAARSSANAPAGSSAQPASGAPSSGNAPPPATRASAPASAAPAASTAAQTADPVLKQALSDASYRYQRPPAPKNQSDLAANTEQAKANVAARQTLKADSDDATKAAAQAQTYLQAAKSIMDSKGANVGAYGGLIAEASALLPGQSVDATNYQEVAKYLGNAALANARGIYGNRMTQSEVGLQLNELSPSVHMTDTAINNLLNTNLKAAQYTIDSAKRVVPYLSAGNDAANFSKWNQQYWNQGNTVNPPAAKTMPSAGKLQAYAAAHFGGDTAKAQAFLQSRGYK
jgi:hypothetical protein